MNERTTGTDRDHASAAPARPSVVFEETGETREVTSYCLRCQADSDFTIVSPSGKAHYSSETGEDTRCGIDATRENWWHRL